MSLDKKLVTDMVKITSSAAISCLEFLGKNDKELIDKAATDSMRNEINKLKINGVVVIGEGELDEAPMLHIGEKLGAGGDLDKVEIEDQEIVEATQRGVLSKSYERGRYSPKMETGVHHFHRILTMNG